MKTITLQQPKSKPGYDFFYRSQLIFTPYQAGQRIYAVLEGQVALYNGSYRVFTIQAGHCLVEDQLPSRGDRCGYLCCLRQGVAQLCSRYNPPATL